MRQLNGTVAQAGAARGRPWGTGAPSNSLNKIERGNGALNEDHRKIPREEKARLEKEIGDTNDA